MLARGGEGRPDSYVSLPRVPRWSLTPWVSPHFPYLPELLHSLEIHRRRRVWPTSLTGGERPGECGCGGTYGPFT